MMDLCLGSFKLFEIFLGVFLFREGYDGIILCRAFGIHFWRMFSTFVCPSLVDVWLIVSLCAFHSIGMFENGAEIVVWPLQQMTYTLVVSSSFFPFSRLLLALCTA